MRHLIIFLGSYWIEGLGVYEVLKLKRLVKKGFGGLHEFLSSNIRFAIYPKKQFESAK